MSRLLTRPARVRLPGKTFAYLIPEDEWKIAKKALVIVRKRAKSLRRDDPILFEESKGDLTALAMKLNNTSR